MIIITTSTTKKLEKFAKTYDMNVGIIKSPDNTMGNYFIVNKNNSPLTQWISLGWTAVEAKERLIELFHRG